LTIEYLDADFSVNDTFTEFTVFKVNGTSRVIPNVDWPAEFTGVSFAYEAGYSEIDQVPEDLLHAMCIYSAMSDQDRSLSAGGPWAALDAILLPYRLPSLA
jgi:hypothetical protein